MRTIRDVMNMKMDDFELSVRSSNCMKNMGIETLSQLTGKTMDEISRMRNMGKKSLGEINEKLEKLGLTYNMDDKAWLQWGLKHIELIKAL